MVQALDLKYLMYLAHLTTGGFSSVRFDRTFAATQRRHRMPKSAPSFPACHLSGMLAPQCMHTHIHTYIYIEYIYIYIYIHIYRYI